jgi:hypothetical protein
VEVKVNEVGEYHEVGRVVKVSQVKAAGGGEMMGNAGKEHGASASDGGNFYAGNREGIVSTERGITGRLCHALL